MRDRIRSSQFKQSKEALIGFNTSKKPLTPTPLPGRERGENQLLHTKHVLHAAQDDGPIGNSRRGPEHFVEGVFAEDFELGAGLEDVGGAAVVEGVDFAAAAFAFVQRLISFCK